MQTASSPRPVHSMVLSVVAMFSWENDTTDVVPTVKAFRLILAEPPSRTKYVPLVLVLKMVELTVSVADPPFSTIVPPANVSEPVLSLRLLLVL